MFGFVAANLNTIDEEEKDRYQALYCGLCRTLKDRYGQISRACLTYDMTFLVMLSNALQEPPEDKGRAYCVVHPKKKMPYAISKNTEYAADLSVALAYHKCLDDWHDDKSAKAFAASKALASAYKKAKQRIPNECDAIERAMAEIAVVEAQGQDAEPDAAASIFGEMLGDIFAHDQGFWEEDMRAFGNRLGRFIYMMDAAVDLKDDQKHNRYNPFTAIISDSENMRTLLMVLIGEATEVFERLPIEQDLHLLRSILYAGVWQQFNKTYEIATHDVITHDAEQIKQTQAMRTQDVNTENGGEENG